MNTVVSEGKELVDGILSKLSTVPSDVQLIVAPPFTHLSEVASKLAGSSVALAAQNCADHEKGAYTGEVSVAMLKSVGCSYVILGHAERREY